MNQPGTGLDALPQVQPAKSRLLITLVVDTSASMSGGGRIDELNRALGEWRAVLLANDHIRRHGEIALVTFGNGHVQAVDPTGAASGQPAEPYVAVTRFDPPRLEAGGVTPMVDGLQYAFDLLAARRNHLHANGHPMSNRPLVYMITDGVPTDGQGRRSDSWRDFAPVIRQQESGKHLLFFAFGVDGAEEDVLRGLAPQSWHQLGSAGFARVLKLMSTSIESVAAATGGDETADVSYKRANEQMEKEERMRRFLEETG